ncbi:HeH/LEM domain-containing protein [Limosilactobacillus oris]|uniref:HeH/LEM domain-containing protein n=1 Tax=Limosilactobacillus oris TaxID=1632 RepID=UPI002A5A5F4B|nr:HeH/LEM domain-containing protein [Limosilactobacillus oris]
MSNHGCHEGIPRTSGRHCSSNYHAGKIDSSAGDTDVKPTSANTVAEIKTYLDKHGISYNASATKEKLLALVK